MPYDRYPAIDETNNFAPAVRQALAESPQIAKEFVHQGDVVINVKDYYPNGYTAGSTDVKSAFDAAVAEASEGATVMFEPGADYFLSKGNIINKALTIDLNGSSFIVDPTPGTGTAGSPVFHFSGTLSPTTHALNTVVEGSFSVTTSVAINAVNYTVGDVVIISDSTVVLPWDSTIPGSTPLYPAGYTGREEINFIQAIDAVTGIITLNKPTKWGYSVTPLIQKVTKVLKNPRVINARKITEVDPGGLNNSSLIGANAPHLIHFQYSENAVVEQVHFDSWNLHAVNFHRCINPVFRESSGRNPFRPTDGGHGYLSRFDRCLGGSVEHTYSYRVRHHTDYVMTYNATSSQNHAVFPISCAYMGHGLGSKHIVSAFDSIEDGGAGWGWSVGNGAFGPDFDFTIISPRYSGVGVAINFQASSRGLKVISPEITTRSRCVVMTTGASGLDISRGYLKTIWSTGATNNSVLVRDKAGAADAYGLRPGSIRMDGVELRGANPVISIEAAGSVRLNNLIAEELDSVAVGGTVNVIQFNAVPAALDVSGNNFSGVFTNGVYSTVAAPAGQYTVERNDIRGYTSRAITFPAAVNLRFVDNSANNNGGGLNPWNITGDLATAKIGAGGYAAVVMGNSPRTLDESRVSAVTVSGAAGTNRSVTLNTDDTARWILRGTTAAETGSDAGTDLEMIARTDAGAAGPQVFFLKRIGDSIWGAAGKKLGFLGSAGAVKATLTGSRAGETAAATSLRAAIVGYGLATDSTSTGVSVKTANYTLTTNDGVIISNGASLTMTLPDPTTVQAGQRFLVKNTHASAASVVSAGTSKTIDGAASLSLAQWVGVEFISDGSNWVTPVPAGLELKAPIASPTFTGTVGGVTKTHVGLSNADNTSDVNKPVSTLQQTALDAKAPKAAPVFTGVVESSTGDFEATTVGKSLVVKSPDGTRYRITVANGGALTAVPA